MNTPIETLQDCATEAEYQLICAMEQTTWLLALARAIQLAHTHGRGEIGEGLIGLSNYLSDTCFGNVTAAIREFSELSRQPVAPTKLDSEQGGGA
ncbi:hypothetical protein [Pseudomonas cichorii]|uniref:Uncharacterized protein n=1 Tax=Pseudomonas cichorii TaxID=36746 RepID=A0ABQ1DTB5_PSECI|nr:hypothetical protein [Pseudomonas cichorii]AHF66017.1 hypothetical protein PCH70_08640 [Pseudomonas cichorii JBC1]QVE17983.1 hypothetical protein KGD89_04280 [Pseudomonas cichorii]GFM94164.1 hypothetical protein PSCICP_41360 [Pseudomonas cichorii]SDP00222.1 hypothetical protein SAMN05216599_116127 [Pseudomonas cichorii]